MRHNIPNQDHNRIQADMHRHKDKHTHLTYSNEKEQHYEDTSLVTRIFMWGVGVVILAAIIYTIFFW